MRRVTILALAVVAIALIPALITSSRSSAQSLGFYPSVLTIENGLRGQEYHVETVLVNQAADKRVFDLQASGDTAGWVTFFDPSDLETPLDTVEVGPESERKLIVAVAVPETAANGAHTGVNAFDGYTEVAFRDREGLVMGLQQQVQVNVTGDQVLDLQVGDVSAATTEVGQPLHVNIQLTNAGNVDVSPQLNVLFAPTSESGSADPVAEIETELEMVRAGASGTSVAEWDTTGRTPGVYRATYSLALEGAPLEDGSFEFELVPFGSLARSGSVLSITPVDPLEPGSIGRADVVFENTGAIDSSARFEGQLFRDGVAIAAAASPGELIARPGEQVTLSAYFDIPDEEGAYEVRGRVFFESAQTDEVSATFDVGGGRSWGSLIALGGLAVAAIAAVSMGGMWLVQRRRVATG